MRYLIVWLIFGLIAGHAVWGHRWVIDGTRDIITVYIDLYRKLRNYIRNPS